ncbi:serine hydrolase [Roseobacter fucihabitans]|uniref:serine hydrolase domain-containing protein n=1 Tax=Roseobacter fucihabitans TaxID=1537242 RepID=UPI001652CB57|nr:serine hydrolase domain-containing protein [Roseobacter litoralis]
MAPYRGGATALVTNIVHNGEMSVTASGKVDHAQSTPPEDLIFEIGSITKVFTALLLSLLVEEGKIDANRPINALAKELSDIPSWITLRALATHTSGLPRIHVPLWKALIFSLPDDPYATFSRGDLFAWFNRHKGSKRPRRMRHAYSNLGYGLLGEALAISEGKPFQELLTEMVIAPLGLVDTSSHLTVSQQARFMQPFNTRDKAVTPWTFQAIAGAGCLRSTARDLGRFSNAVIGALVNPVTPLDRAICQSVKPELCLGPRGATEPVAQCLGWLSIKVNANAPRMLFHNGGTAGSTSSLYICPAANAAVTILSNRGVAAGLRSRMQLQQCNPDQAINDLFAAIE